MPIGCSNAEDCLSLRDGRWGRVVGVRVTHVAAGVWAGALLAAAGVAGEWRAGAMHAVLWHLLTVGVLVAALAGVWFLLLQAIVLRRWCLRCNLAHSATFVAMVVVVILAPAGLPWLVLLGIAASLVGLLIALQVLFPPKQFVVTPAPVTTSESTAEIFATSPDLTLEPQQPVISCTEPASAPPSSPISQPIAPAPSASPTPAIARLVGGRVVLRIDQWPLLGSPGATHVVALMMDYLCSDCLHMHRLLLEAVERSQGTLAVLLLPVPWTRRRTPA